MGFSDKSSKLCYIAPYCAVINNYGYNISEEYLFGVSKGIGFRYSYIHHNKQVNKAISNEDWISIVGSTDIKNNIKEAFGIEFYENYDQNNEKLLEFCKEEIKEERVIIIFLDVYYLKYHPQYQKIHAQTNVILYDISHNEDDLYIFDEHVSTVPISVYKGSITKDEFFNALIKGSNVFNDEEMGLVAHRYIRPFPKFKLWGSIKENATEMLNPSQEHYGVKGIICLSEEIMEWEEIWTKENLMNVFRKAYLHITGRGGPAISRKVYGEFLSKYCQIKDYDMNCISEGFLECSKKWNSIAMKFFRGSLNLKKEILCENSSILREISEVEGDLFYKLENIGVKYDENNFKSK